MILIKLLHILMVRLLMVRASIKVDTMFTARARMVVLVPEVLLDIRRVV